MKNFRSTHQGKFDKHTKDSFEKIHGQYRHKHTYQGQLGHIRKDNLDIYTKDKFDMYTKDSLTSCPGP